MSVHSHQLESILRRGVQEILARGLSDPRVRGLISVTAVEISPDLAHARVSVSVLPAEAAPLTLHGLRHAAPHIRSALAERVSMRRLPALRFVLDESIKREAGIFAAIDEARRGEEQPGGASGLETAREDPEP